MTIWDIIKHITETKDDMDFSNEEIKKEYKIYNINRTISFCDIYLPLVNAINKCMNMPRDVHYRFFRDVLPKRQQYFKYIKKLKDDVDSETKDRIIQYYQCSSKDVEDYLDILTEEQVEKVVRSFDGGRQ
jgi:hypothetical protein